MALNFTGYRRQKYFQVNIYCYQYHLTHISYTRVFTLLCFNIVLHLMLIINHIPTCICNHTISYRGMHSAPVLETTKLQCLVHIFTHLIHKILMCCPLSKSYINPKVNEIYPRCHKHLYNQWPHILSIAHYLYWLLVHL